MENGRHSRSPASTHRKSRVHFGAFGDSARYTHTARIRSVAATARFRSAEKIRSEWSTNASKKAPILRLRLIDHLLYFLDFSAAERAPLRKRCQKCRKRPAERRIDQRLSLRAVKRLARDERADRAAVVLKKTSLAELTQYIICRRAFPAQLLLAEPSPALSRLAVHAPRRYPQSATRPRRVFLLPCRFSPVYYLWTNLVYYK